MNRAVVWILASALLVPSLAEAQGFTNGSISGTYALSGSERSLPARVLCNGAAICGGVDNASTSAAAVAHRIGLDIKNGKCLNVAAALKGNAAIALSKALENAGDERFFDGLIIYDGAGNITGGTTTFNSFSTAAGISNGALLNVNDLGTAVMSCGGAQASGGAAGTCSAVCNAASFNCDTKGGYTVGSDGRGTETVYQYPLTRGLCGSSVTWDECCADPTLVTISHRSCTASNVTVGVAQKVRCTITNQGTAGSVEESLQ